MRIAAHYVITIASALSSYVLTACGGQAKAELASIDALSEALGADVRASICTGNRKPATGLLPMQTKVALSQMPAQSIENRNSNGVTEVRKRQAERGASSKSMASMDHSHIPVAVPKSAPAPQLSVSLTRDVMSGYNLVINTANYEMAPPPIGVVMENLMSPRTNSETGFVQGHAHLYINSEKIQRVYGHNIHIPASHFKEGMNQLNITINNHAHMFWTYEDKQIISSMFINTNTSKLVMHQFDSFPVTVN